MGFQDDPSAIRWHLHLRVPPARVYDLLATDEGRARFWAEAAEEHEGAIVFRFPNGLAHRGRILGRIPASRFVVDYFGGSHVTFELAGDGKGGTDLFLTATDVPPEGRTEEIAGWVSVLLALKATAEFGVDLRNHDPSRTWDQGYADN